MALQSLAGFIVFAALGWLISERRGYFPIKIVLIGVLTQFALAGMLLKFEFFTRIFFYVNQAVLALEEATRSGTAFVFGYVGGGEKPFAVTDSSATFILAFQALPLVLVISAISSVLFYWRILPRVVNVFSWLLKKGLSVGGAEGLGVSANIFVGMVEAPLLIRPYVSRLSRSELFTVMTSGMATIAGTVLAVYASILDPVIPNVAGHILTASIISAPAAIVVSKIMVPETGALTSGELTVSEESASAMDALTRGTLQGIELFLNIIAMIIVLVALVHLVNIILSLFPSFFGSPLTLERIFGWIMAPVVWLMGIPWSEVDTAGRLLGTKTVLNEFIAYIQMSRLPEESLSPRSLLIMSYALCGFANPGSLGIMIGGLGAMAPERRGEIVSMGLKAVVAGTLATCMTGAVVGVLS
jgi:CNT family concentrative nucleoside transporter